MKLNSLEDIVAHDMRVARNWKRVVDEHRNDPYRQANANIRTIIAQLFFSF